MPREDEPPAASSKGGYGAHYVNGMNDVVLQTLIDCGFRFFVRPDPANVIIGTRLTSEEMNRLKIWTRINHFASVTLIGSKAELHRRMRELRVRLGHEVPFYPLAFYPPDEYEELLEAWETRPIWILKAPALSRGRAIRLVRPGDERPPMLPYVIEEYIPRPLLITGRKFDVRLYALVTSVFPLVIYFHPGGLCLFATSPYGTDGDLSDLTAHVTNYQINKTSKNFVVCEGLDERVENSKWSLGFLWRYLEEQGIDWRRVKGDVEDIAIATIIAGMCPVRNAHEKEISRQFRRSSYELLGVDLLIDEDLKIWLLEVNITPGMVGTSDLDIFVKKRVAYDMFNIVRMLDFRIESPQPCKEYARIERIARRSVSTARRQGVVNGTIRPWDDPVFLDYMIVREFVDEQTRKRRFYRVYPKRKMIGRYMKCFDRYSYEDIVLNEWIKLDHQQRMAVLRKKLDVHREEMKITFPSRDQTAPNPSLCGIV
jgi:tubulin polyglutamylase TTLL4